jgi:hypothetical protein
MNVRRERAVGLTGMVIALAVGWNEGWGGSLASWTAAALWVVSFGMLMITIKIDE